jgi:hypothetical protein
MKNKWKKPVNGNSSNERMRTTFNIDSEGPTGPDCLLCLKGGLNIHIYY